MPKSMKPSRNAVLLFFCCEHRVPGRELYRSLVQHLEDICRDVFLLYYETEHILVKPLVSHNETAFVA